MLQIKQKFHINWPEFKAVQPKPLQFSPVQNDDDELTQDIVHDVEKHDDEWQLDERPDEAKLEAFWNEVETDIENDPTWNKFSEQDT